MPQQRTSIFEIIPLAVVFILLVAGCGPLAEPAARPNSPEGRTKLLSLPGVSQTTSLPLQDELARLRVEQALPEQWLVTRRESPSLIVWEDVFPQFTRQNIAGQVDSLQPSVELQWGPAELLKARGTFPRLLPIREKFIKQLEGTTALDVDAPFGLLASQQSLEAIQLGARLEVVYAAYQLAEDHPTGAFQSAATLLRIARLLGNAGPVRSRLAAAAVRAHALRVLVAAHNHPLAPPDVASSIVPLLEDELKHWPSDVETWRTEQTEAMLAYELVRGGYFLSLLDENETKRLRSQNMLKVTAKSARQSVDADQLQYLQIARRLITAAEQPYSARLPEFAKIRSELADVQGTPSFPLVAGMLLLADFELVNQRQTEDLARVRSLRLAFQHARGDTAVAAENPLTGKMILAEISHEEIVLPAIPPGSEPAYRLRKVRTIARR